MESIWNLLEIIGRKEKLKLLGVSFEQVPVNWDTHIDYLLSKASSRLYILRICRYYGYTNTALSDLLSPQRTRQLKTRSHDYILTRVQTSRFKSVFINRCLFNSN